MIEIIELIDQLRKEGQRMKKPRKTINRMMTNVVKAEEAEIENVIEKPMPSLTDRLL